MNTLLIVSISLVTVSIVSVSVYVIIALIQFKRTAGEVEGLIKNVNKEVETIDKITTNVSEMVKQFSSPWAKAGVFVSSILSGYLSKKGLKKQPEKPEKQEAGS